MAAMERWIGRALLAGVITSAAIVIAGGAIYLIGHGAAMVDYSTFHGVKGTYDEQVRGILDSSRRFSGRGVIQLGLLLLIAVQVLRVALMLWLFQHAGDRHFVWISLFVLIGLLYSLLGAG